MTKAKTQTESEYVLSEVAWLLSFGVHPEAAAEQVGRKPRSLYMLALTHGDETVRRAFVDYASARKVVRV